MLRTEIAEGVHEAGGLLPTEAELCRRFEVSRHTVREALRTLRDERLVESRQGAGTIVSPLSRADEFQLEALSINDLAAYASELQLEVRSVGMETISRETSQWTGIPEGENWLAVRGFAMAKGQPLPVCWSEHFIHADFAIVEPFVRKHRGPLFLLIEKVSGEAIAEIAQDVSAALVPDELAGDFGVEPRSAGMDVWRSYRTQGGRVAQITLHHHPANRFRFSTVMRRIRE